MLCHTGTYCASTSSSSRLLLYLFLVSGRPRSPTRNRFFAGGGGHFWGPKVFNDTPQLRNCPTPWQSTPFAFRRIMLAVCSSNSLAHGTSVFIGLLCACKIVPVISKFGCWTRGKEQLRSIPAIRLSIPCLSPFFLFVPSHLFYKCPPLLSPSF